MRKTQVEKLRGVSAADCLSGSNMGPYCREIAVAKDEPNSLKVYPVLCLVC